MERLPTDIQDVIYEKAHRLQFAQCLQELPFKLWGFYYIMDHTTTNDDEEWNMNGDCICIDELDGEYWNRMMEIEESIADFDLDHALIYQHEFFDKWENREWVIGRLAKTLQSDIRNGTLRYTLPYVM